MLGQRGDTIIEVLFATTLFSMIAVATLSIMNQGTGLTQRALEITLVREQIDAQADALRYLNQAYVAQAGKVSPVTNLWKKVTANRVDQALPFSDMVDASGKCVLPIQGQNPFALNIEKLSSDQALLTPQRDVVSYAKVTAGKAEGLWIQAVRGQGTDGKTDHYDFHIRACWESMGGSRPVTLGTIVRLYEPNEL